MRTRFFDILRGPWRCGGAAACLCLLAAALPSLCGADAAAALSGKDIYEKSCAKCHDSGMGAFFTGAPRIGTDAWKARLGAAGSIDALLASAARGKGKMPAQGGASGLSDAELKSAIEYILGSSPH